MQEKTKQNLIVVVVGVVLFAALMNFSTVLSFLRQIYLLVRPMIAGCIVALFLNVPMNGIEKRLKALRGKGKKKPSDNVIHVASFLLMMLAVILVLVLVLTLLVPELVRSCKSLYDQIEADIPRWISILSNLSANIDWADELGRLLQVVRENQDKILESITSGLESLSTGLNGLASNVVGVVAATVSGVSLITLSFIIAMYILLGKERLCRNANTLLHAYCNQAWVDRILRFCRLFQRSFTSFLTGQCGEAVILGTLMFLAFTIFRLPYGALVGVLTALCAIIPYVGAFISCTVSVLLLLLVNPFMALRGLIVYLVVQFIENQFIYPRVVGGSVGLSPFYTLIAVLLGGKLFGILGILFFIPLMKVVLEILKSDSSRRLSKKQAENASAQTS